MDSDDDGDEESMRLEQVLCLGPMISAQRGKAAQEALIHPLLTKRNISIGAFAAIACGMKKANAAPSFRERAGSAKEEGTAPAGGGQA